VFKGKIYSIVLCSFACSCAQMQSSVSPVPALGVIDQVTSNGPTTEKFVGKPTALFFCSCWCKVCVEELPRIDRLARALESRGIQVRAVAMMDDRVSAESTIRAKNFQAAVVLDTEGRIGKAVGVHGLPAMVLLNSQGQVRNMLDPADGIERKLIDGPRNWDDPEVATYLLGVKSCDSQGTL